MYFCCYVYVFLLYVYVSVFYFYITLFMFMYLIVGLCASWHSSATLTEVFPCFFLSCKANAKVNPAKMGQGPHSSIFVLFYVLFIVYFCVVLCIVCV